MNKNTLGNTKKWYTVAGKRYYTTMTEAMYHKQKEVELSRGQKSAEVYNSSKETTTSSKRVKRDGHSVSKDVYRINRQRDRLTVRAALANDWGIMRDSGYEIVEITSVRYIPENTFSARESRGNRKCRMLVAASSIYDGSSYQVNIADEMHRLVGNCSKFRAERLVENKPIQLRLDGTSFRLNELKAWFRNANLPIKTR